MPWRWRRYHFAGQFRNVLTWLGERTSPKSVATGVLIERVLSEQAQRHGSQVFAAEANRQPFRVRVLFGGERRFYASRLALCVECACRSSVVSSGGVVRFRVYLGRAIAFL